MNKICFRHICFCSVILVSTLSSIWSCESHTDLRYRRRAIAALPSNYEAAGKIISSFSKIDSHPFGRCSYWTLVFEDRFIQSRDLLFCGDTIWTISNDYLDNRCVSFVPVGVIPGTTKDTINLAVNDKGCDDINVPALNIFYPSRIKSFFVHKDLIMFEHIFYHDITGFSEAGGWLPQFSANITCDMISGDVEISCKTTGNYPWFGIWY